MMENVKTFFDSSFSNMEKVLYFLVNSISLGLKLLV